MLLLPKNDKVNLQLADLCRNAQVIVFVGLPGTGKSLYINHLYHFANEEGYRPQLIQWDVCRKEFEKGDLSSKFPTAAGQVHPAVRLSAGHWLLSYLKNWCNKNLERDNSKLFIEAPLVGNRFSELCHVQGDAVLESMLQSDQIQFVLPIPTNEVRVKIEQDRLAQVSETSQIWSGAKPSVLVQLWKDTLAIAQSLQLTSYQEAAYQAKIYRNTYAYILRHRQTVILDIDKTYNVAIQDESTLHSLKNETPTLEEVMQSVDHISATYTSDIQMVSQVDRWHDT